MNERLAQHHGHDASAGILSLGRSRSRLLRVLEGLVHGIVLHPSPVISIAVISPWFGGGAGCLITFPCVT
jgi:hypothetical protein